MPHRHISTCTSEATSECVAMLKHIKYHTIKAVHDFALLMVATLGADKQHEVHL